MEGNQRMNIPPRGIINRHIFIFIYNLLKYIIYDSDQSEKLEKTLKEKRLKKIKLFINLANEEIYQLIKKSSNSEEKKITPKELNTDYSKENFKNIILFIKQQNQIYVGDILDSILIQICGFAMKIGPYDTINEYIFNNLKNIKGDIEQARKFINVEVFKDEKIKQNLYPPFGKMIICPFLYLLFYSYKAKLEIINNGKEYNDYDTMKYIFNYYIDGVNNYYIDDLSKTVNSYLSQQLKKEKLSKLFNIHYLEKSFLIEFDIINKLLDPNKDDDLLPTSKSPLDILESFFYTLFVYYKTINDGLIKYSQQSEKEKKEVVNINFTYDIENGLMDSYYALIVTSPIKIIKKIKKIGRASCRERV